LQRATATATATATAPATATATAPATVTVTVTATATYLVGSFYFLNFVSIFRDPSDLIALWAGVSGKLSIKLIHQFSVTGAVAITAAHLS